MEYTDIINHFNKLTIISRKPLLNDRDVQYSPDNTTVSSFRAKTGSDVDSALTTTLFNKVIVTPPNANIVSEPNSLHNVRNGNIRKSRGQLMVQREKGIFPIILDQEDNSPNNKNERNGNSTETKKIQNSDTPKKRPGKRRECARRKLFFSF